MKVVYQSGNGKSSDRRKAAGSRLRSNVYSFTQEDDGCFNCISGVTLCFSYIFNFMKIKDKF